MTICIIGSGDRIALPKLNMCQTSLGSDIHYTKPKYRNFFSKYGFAIPLNYESVPYQAVMDGKLSLHSDHVQRFSRNLRYLLIDHNGDVSFLDVAIDDSEIREAKGYVYTDEDNGWWMTVDPDLLNHDYRQLLGFLYTDPDRNKIDDYFHTYWMGSKLLWISISAVVECLNEQFPKEEPKL